MLSLCNLALLTGQVGRYGAGLSPLRGQNNVQGGGDMGALPNKLPGFQDVVDDAARAKFDAAWGASVPPSVGWHLTQMFEAMGRGDLRALLVIGENPAQSEADVGTAVELLTGLDHLVVVDIYRTRTAELADVVLPGSASWCESDGTVTNSERRVQRVRKALDPPGAARDDIDILLDLAGRHVDRLAQPARAAEAARLHAGVVRVETATRGEPQWVVVVELVDGRVVLDDTERGGPPALGRIVGPQTPVQVWRFERVVGVTRPLDAAELVEPRPRHPGVHRREPA